MADGSDFGPGGSVFTKNIETGKRVASRLNAGMMFVNKKLVRVNSINVPV